MLRALTPEENKLVEHFSEKLDEKQRVQLLSDLRKSLVETKTEVGGPIICFHIQGYQRPPFRGQHVIAEGKILDQDNTEVSILLHADKNSRLYELEFIRWDDTEDSKIINLNWSTLEIFETPKVPIDYFPPHGCFEIESSDQLY